MSDPTGRRGDNIEGMLKDMREDLDENTGKQRGWSWRKMGDELFARYRFGIREQTIKSILIQLKDRGEIVPKHIRKASGARITLWFARERDSP